MAKPIRRMLWGIRKHLTKNLLVVTLICSVIFTFVTYYDECSFGAFPLLVERSRCSKLDSIKEKLNVTILSDTFRSSKSGLGVHSERKVKWGNWNNNSIMTAAKVETVSSNLKRKRLPPTHSVETDTEFPLEMDFQKRKEVAQNACTHMLNLALAKENKGIDVNFEDNESSQNVEFSAGSRGRRLPKKTFYNQDMLQIMRLRNKPKYFKGTVGVKKNRWIHFHRITKSPIRPSENKVVEIKWCPIFKAASTPWLAVFTKLSKALTNSTEAQIKRGKLGFMELARMFRLLTPRIYEKDVHVIKYTMVVARHPFKRLLSAYRDKIERVKGRLYYYNKYSTKILTRYRKWDGVGVGRQRKLKDTDPSVKVPTFEEFVRYVLSTEPRKWDEHWRPMYLDCNPCYRTFDFILKVETLNDDKDKVMQYLHVSPLDPMYKEVEDVWVRWNNPSGKNGPSRNESFYFSQLTTGDIQKLYELYEPDFQIFDYRPDEYFLMGREQVTTAIKSDK